MNKRWFITGVFVLCLLLAGCAQTQGGNETGNKQSTGQTETASTQEAKSKL